MEIVPINMMAVIVATIIGQAVGFAWFGPLFGKQWAKLALGMSPQQLEEAKKKGMSPQTIALSLLGTFLMAYVLAHSIYYAEAVMKTSGTNSGLQGGFWNWLGFVAPVLMGKVLWDGKSWNLFWLESGHYLVSLCLMGLTLALWQ